VDFTYTRGSSYLGIRGGGLHPKSPGKTKSFARDFANRSPAQALVAVTQGGASFRKEAS
jgi:hypothetical protein